MSDVVEHSLQYLSDEDLSAIARYLKTLPPKDGKQQAAPVEDSVAKDLWRGNDSKPGAALYVDNCAALPSYRWSWLQACLPGAEGQPGGADRRRDLADPHCAGRQYYASGERGGFQTSPCRRLAGA
ncbi:Gluconate 2-dehydrogenase cytochrome c subunit precursor [Serratia fonticola]|uniref:Gluconate 2-dehydrogenase cytochrome c subunit n=1 Tax=Serratia fonticola TaxID=47917 RepID=A0A4U9VFS3_SERFO|nr:Gluconate 2-dehydrogenase cytochrome c subunit precursor [Serratia fonticola]